MSVECGGGQALESECSGDFSAAVCTPNAPLVQHVSVLWLRDYLAVGKTLASIYKKRLSNRTIKIEVACTSTQLHADLLVEAQRYGQQ